jgi:hypothetical protein
MSAMYESLIAQPSIAADIPGKKNCPIAVTTLRSAQYRMTENQVVTREKFHWDRAGTMRCSINAME